MAGGDSKLKMQENHQDVKNKKEKKKKDSSSEVEALKSALKALPPDQQVATVLAKYSQLAEENRRTQSTSKSVERQMQLAVKEKEQMESEHSKAVLARSRLESLCRELQRQNKTIKDENLTRLREEEERRKEVSNKFNNTLSEISNLMQENTEKNSKLRDENQEMANRLKDLIKQYETREQHVDKMLNQKDLQAQLAEAKLAKANIDFTESKEKYLTEKKGYLEQLSDYQQKVTTMSMTEISLRTQLNSYIEKYEEFQGTLDKSNKIFSTFKKEMDEMTKKIKKLEKERKSWRERWESANKALLDMVSERTTMENKLELQTKQNTQLQNLCRALQQQIVELRSMQKNGAAGESMIEERITSLLEQQTMISEKREKSLERETSQISQGEVKESVCTETTKESSIIQTKEKKIESKITAKISMNKSNESKSEEDEEKEETLSETEENSPDDESEEESISCDTTEQLLTDKSVDIFPSQMENSTLSEEAENCTHEPARVTCKISDNDLGQTNFITETEPNSLVETKGEDAIKLSIR